jgi:hypothetical protein
VTGPREKLASRSSSECFGRNKRTGPDSGTGIDGVAESLEREETGTQLDLTLLHVPASIVVVMPCSANAAWTTRPTTTNRISAGGLRISSRTGMKDLKP